MAGREALRRALLAMVPQIDELQKKRELMKQQQQAQQRQQAQPYSSPTPLADMTCPPGRRKRGRH